MTGFAKLLGRPYSALAGYHADTHSHLAGWIPPCVFFSTRLTILSFLEISVIVCSLLFVVILVAALLTRNQKLWGLSLWLLVSTLLCGIAAAILNHLGLA